jgi:hypothetical protein
MADLVHPDLRDLSVAQDLERRVHRLLDQLAIPAG